MITTFNLTLALKAKSYEVNPIYVYTQRIRKFKKSFHHSFCTIKQIFYETDIAGFVYSLRLSQNTMLKYRVSIKELRGF